MERKRSKLKVDVEPLDFNDIVSTGEDGVEFSYGGKFYLYSITQIADIVIDKIKKSSNIDLGIYNLKFDFEGEYYEVLIYEDYKNLFYDNNGKYSSNEVTNELRRKIKLVLDYTPEVFDEDGHILKIGHIGLSNILKVFFGFSKENIVYQIYGLKGINSKIVVNGLLYIYEFDSSNDYLYETKRVDNQDFCKFKNSSNRFYYNKYFNKNYMFMKKEKEEKN